MKYAILTLALTAGAALCQEAETTTLPEPTQTQIEDTQTTSAAEETPVEDTQEAVTLPFDSVEELLEAARLIDFKRPWYKLAYAHHGAENISSGALWLDEDVEGAELTALQLEDCIRLWVYDYKHAELVWFKCTDSKIRVLLLTTFYCGMKPQICCFPAFGKYAEQCFGAEIGAQRLAEIQWVKQHCEQLKEIIGKQIQQAKKYGTDAYSD